MKKEVLVFAVLVLVLIPVVFASVDIQIKTLPDHRMSIIIREAGGLASLDSFHIETGDGNVEISSDVSKSEVDIIITLKDGVTEILRKGIKTTKLSSEMFTEPRDVSYEMIVDTEIARIIVMEER